MRTILIALALGACTIGTAAQAQTYSAYDSFNVSGGALVGSGPYSFGLTPPAGFDGSLQAFAQIEQACGGDTNIQCARNSVVGVYKAPAGDYDQPGSAFYAAGLLNLHPGASGEQAGIQFLAPVAGNYTISGTLTAHDVIANQKNYTLYSGLTVIGLGNFTTGPLAFSASATLNAGDRLTFLLGFGNDGFQNDSTGLELSVTGPGIAGSVPEPASWAMMIGGFGLVGGAVRRRRFNHARLSATA